MWLALKLGTPPPQYKFKGPGFPLFRELVKQEGFDSLPVFLGGISLGGCIALTSLLEEVGAQFGGGSSLRRGIHSFHVELRSHALAWACSYT